jgi:hypothetical protein
MMASQDATDRLQRMIDDLRRVREHCEPKSNQNPLHLHCSNAVSALKWIIENSATESRAD